MVQLKLFDVMREPALEAAAKIGIRLDVVQKSRTEQRLVLVDSSVPIASLVITRDAQEARINHMTVGTEIDAVPLLNSFRTTLDGVVEVAGSVFAARDEDGWSIKLSVDDLAEYMWGCLAYSRSQVDASICCVGSWSARVVEVEIFRIVESFGEGWFCDRYLSEFREPIVSVGDEVSWANDHSLRAAVAFSTRALEDGIKSDVVDVLVRARRVVVLGLMSS